jgi:hypothetical protein
MSFRARRGIHDPDRGYPAYAVHDQEPVFARIAYDTESG